MTINLMTEIDLVPIRCQTHEISDKCDDCQLQHVLYMCFACFEWILTSTIWEATRLTDGLFTKTAVYKQDFRNSDWAVESKRGFQCYVILYVGY